MNGIRWWRLAHLGRNPLVRRGDRWESAFLAVVALLVLAVVPFAWHLGRETYEHQRAAAVAAAADRYPVTATLLADAPAQEFSPHGIPADGTGAVQAAWRTANGQERSGIVAAERGTAAGTVVPIWLDRAGNAVASPPERGDALLVAIMTAAMAWLAFALSGAAAFLFVRHLDDRRRARRWEAEWAAFRRGRTHW